MGCTGGKSFQVAETPHLWGLRHIGAPTRLLGDSKMDFHAEAQHRFTEDTTPVVAHSNQTVTDNWLKGIDIVEILIDGVQTHDFLRKGTCHEIDPIAKPFVHSLPIQVVTSAALAYGIVHIRPGKLATVVLGVLGIGEAMNVARNHMIGCE